MSVHPPRTVIGRRRARRTVLGAVLAVCSVWSAGATAAPRTAAAVIRAHLELPTASARLVPSSSAQGTMRFDWPDGRVVSATGEEATPSLPLQFVIPAGQTITRVRTLHELTTDLGRAPGLPRDNATLPLLAFTGCGTLRGWTLAGCLAHPLRYDAATQHWFAVRSCDVELELGDSPSAATPLVREDAAEAAATRREIARLVANPADIREAWRGVHPVEHTRDVAPLAPTFRPSLDSSSVSYVIVTTDSLATAFQTFADWRTALGQQTAVRTLSWIRATYAPGIDDADTIRHFLQDAYATWGTRYVLLGGSESAVPSRLVHTNFLGDEEILTDFYFACLDGSWDADGDAIFGEVSDAVDLLPELHVGRVPAETAAQALAWIAKTEAFATRAPADAMTRVLFTSEVLTPQPWSPNTGVKVELDGATFSEMAVAEVPARIAVTRLYENTSAWPNARPETRDSTLAALRAGQMLWDHVGHGYRNTMSVGDNVLLDGDADALAQGLKQGVIFALNCNSASFDYDCIATHFVLNPAGGAVAYIGATRETYPTVAVEYQNDFYARVFQDTTAYPMGPALDAAKAPWLPYSTYDSADRLTQYSLNLLGDPAQSLYWRAPRTFAVAVSPLVVGATSATVTVTANGTGVAGATVALSRSGEGFARAVTNAVGRATLAFTPRSTGAVSVGVSHGSDHDTTFTVVPAAFAASRPMASEGVIVEDGIGGRGRGNGDGVANPGETVHLVVPLRNRGGTPATLPFATLTSLDSLVTVTDALSAYGDIAPDAVQSGDGFTVRVSPRCPDQHMCALRVGVNDETQVFWTSVVPLGVARPRIQVVARALLDTFPDGNRNGAAEVGETLSYRLTLFNAGGGAADSLTLHLAALDATTTVLDSLQHRAALLASHATAAADDAWRFRVVADDEESGTHRFWLWITDAFGQEIARQQLDLAAPSTPLSPSGTGGASSIQLQWAPVFDPDLAGYLVSRSLSAAGPFVAVNVAPDARVAYREESGLAALTPYFYTVVAVDSSGNRSAATAVFSASTTPPLHPGFPLSLGRGTPGSTVVRYASNSSAHYSILAGADKLYDVYPDGSEVRDGDQDPRTLGIYQPGGVYFAASPTLDKLGRVVAVSYNTSPSPRDSSTVWMFDASGDTVGTPTKRWPKTVPGFIWATPACGDLDNDRLDEIVAASSDGWIYAWRSDGTDVRDGDPASSVSGRFASLGGYLYSSPALADLDRDGFLDIVIGGYDGAVHAFARTGVELPGFPVQLFGWVSGSPAVYTRGDTSWVFAGTQQEHYASIRMIRGGAATLQWVRVLTRVGAAPVRGARGGTPLRPTSGNSRQASPALGDLNGDGRPEVVVATTYGQLWALSTTDAAQGATASFWNGGMPVNFGAGTDGVTECSPVIADLTGDGKPDVLMGAENGGLYGFSNTGATLPGFPIMLPGAVRGSPTVWDVDGDGKTDILYAGWDAKLYRWDLNAPFIASAMPWPAFHHDMSHTGRYDGPALVTGVAADDAPATRKSLRLVCLGTGDRAEPGRFQARGLPADAAVEITVFDVRGARVASLDATARADGIARVAWSGRVTGGGRAPAGVYIARASAAGQAATVRFVLVR